MCMHVCEQVLVASPHTTCARADSDVHMRVHACEHAGPCLGPAIVRARGGGWRKGPDLVLVLGLYI